jgi:hypothetical protein
MKKKEILWERVPKAPCVIPEQAIKDHNSISTDELIIFQRKTISFYIKGNYSPPTSKVNLY